MSNITQLLESALEGEPAYEPDLAAIIGVGRRGVRRRRAALTTVALGGSGMAAVALVAAVGTGHPAPTHTSARPVAMTLAELRSSTADQLRSGRLAQARGSFAVRGITAASMPGLVERDAHVRLSRVLVSELSTGDLNLTAAISSAQEQYLNVQIAPSGTLSTAVPTCAEVSGDGPDGDRYTGPCSVTPTADGGYLIVRSGRTADGEYAKTEVDLISSDGSGILAECTNQLADGGLVLVSPSEPAGAGRQPAMYRVGGTDPAVSVDPPLSSTRLESMVHELARQR